MKKLISTLMMACTAALLAVSCTDDATVTYLAKAYFDTAPIVTPDNIVLNSANKYQSVTTISWDKAHFPVDAPITYALQVDVATDTLGNTAWANAVTIAVGEDVMSKTLQGAELNTLAMQLGIPQDVSGQLLVRVAATLDRTAYSPVAVLTVTPFVQVITVTQVYVPGDYQGTADPATAAIFAATDAGVFEGLLTFPAGELGFKFTTGPDWTQFYGSNGSGGVAEGADGNLTVPAAGTYMITLNLNTNTYTAVPYDFGIIGTATAGGWDTDTDMVWDYQNHMWTWTGPLVPGALKFRLNDAWTVNYGADSNGTVMYYDNQGAHNVTEAGNYTVTFAVNTDPATAAYSVTKL